MSPILTIILMLSIFTFSSASTSTPTSIHGSSNSPTKSPFSPITQKSSNFCYSNADCWGSKLGRYSTCVRHACTCDFGYKKVYPSEKCTKIACSYDTECSYLFSGSRCDVTNSCVCEVNYTKNTTTASCEKKGCTYDYDCLGVFTRCDAWNKCACDFGYSKDNYGICSNNYISTDIPVWPIFLWIGGVILVVSIKVLIIVLICRRRRNRRTPGRVLQVPVATIHQQVPGVGVSPGTGQYQQPGQGYAGPAGYPGNYQHAPPMYAAPFGNFQSQPQINPQPEIPSNIYPAVPTN